MALRYLHELVAQEGPRFPLAIGILLNSTYINTSADTEEQLLQLQKQIIGLLRAGGCEFKKWMFNSQLVLHQVLSEDCVQQTSFDP